MKTKTPLFTNPHKVIVALLPTLVIAWLMTILAIQGIGKYGMPIFIATPFFIGFASSLIYGLEVKEKIRPREHYKLGLLALGIFAIGVFLFAIEGLICLIMAAPIGVVFVCIGTRIAIYFTNKKKKETISVLAIGLLLYPSSIYFDRPGREEENIRAITTSVEISAPPESVWAAVIGFTPIKEKPSLLFRLGLSYPTHASIDGTGKGAVRNCYFSTGKFVEPISKWEPPNTLEFDVTSQPEPMTELTMWKIHPPHLNGYFSSKKGRFEITKLGNGRTKLSGTTWYQQKIFPETYWYIWSDLIIHSIHTRVLTHIKNELEENHI